MQGEPVSELVARGASCSSPCAHSCFIHPKSTRLELIATAETTGGWGGYHDALHTTHHSPDTQSLKHTRDRQAPHERHEEGPWGHPLPRRRHGKGQVAQRAMCDMCVLIWVATRRRNEAHRGWLKIIEKMKFKKKFGGHRPRPKIGRGIRFSKNWKRIIQPRVQNERKMTPKWSKTRFRA